MKSKTCNCNTYCISYVNKKGLTSKRKTFNKKFILKLISTTICLFAMLFIKILGISNVAHAEVTFKAMSPVFNRDLLTLDDEPEIWQHLLIASVTGMDSTASWNTGLGTTNKDGDPVRAKVEVTSELGEVLVNEENISTLVKSITWTKSNAATVLGQAAADVGALPLAVEFSDATDFDRFRLGVNTIKIAAEGGPVYTTTLTIVENEFHSRQTWAKNSETGHVIAHMPNLTKSLLETLVTEVMILKNGTRVLKDFSATGLLEVDEATGAVSIRHDRMSSLEPGDYILTFQLPNGSAETKIDHRISFTVVEQSEEPQVHSIKTGDTISEITIASLGIISLLALGVMFKLTKRKSSLR